MSHIHQVGDVVEVLLPAKKTDWKNLDAVEWRRGKVVKLLDRYHNDGEYFPAYEVHGFPSDVLITHVRGASIRAAQ